MVDPFDYPDRDYLVLVNAENQHSLWPHALPVPDGWQVVHGPAARPDCLEHVDRHWTDMRPAGLAARMSGSVDGQLVSR
jgi:MbtH protein